ncbi:unnamed protein product, partial [Ilex paraguariensis]
KITLGKTSQSFSTTLGDASELKTGSMKVIHKSASANNDGFFMRPQDISSKGFKCFLVLD